MPDTSDTSNTTSTTVEVDETANVAVDGERVTASVREDINITQTTKPSSNVDPVIPPIKPVIPVDPIADAVAQSTLMVNGVAPAMALGDIYQSMALSTGLSFDNAGSAQQQLNVVAQAVTSQCTVLLLTPPTAATATATAKLNRSDIPEQLAALAAGNPR